MRWLLVVTAFAASPLLGQTAEARAWADHWADAYGLQRELVYAVIEVESGWNPSAVSSAGAAGLMQLMPDTAAAFGVRNRFDVAENIRGGVAYLAWLSAACRGDWRLVLASYNAGHTRVLRHGLSYDSEEVHAYVKRVAHIYRRNRRETLLRIQGREPR
jgi:soluble lytic murein transglycosylase-like protein